MKLSKKLKAYGRKVLSNQPSKKEQRKKKRLVQRLRKTARARHKATTEPMVAELDTDLEKDQILREYLATGDAEVVDGA